jgi:hypothetical protein
LGKCPTSGSYCVSGGRHACGSSQPISKRNSLHAPAGISRSPTFQLRHVASDTQHINPWPNFQTRYAAAYAAEVSSFIRSVETHKTVEVGPEDSRQVLVLAQAALKCSQVGRPVRLR